MSKMSELFIDIQELLDKELHPIMISNRLGIPVSMVYDVIAATDNREEFSPYETINS